MSLIERTLDSGLILQEYGMDGAAIERELKKRDPLLSLQGWPNPHGKILWKVVREVPEGMGAPETLVSWMNFDTGEPFPLSSGILNELDKQNKNTRYRYIGEDEHNARLERERARQKDRDAEAIVDDHVFKHGRPVLPRTPGLVASRRRARRDGKPHYG